MVIGKRYLATVLALAAVLGTGAAAASGGYHGGETYYVEAPVVHVEPVVEVVHVSEPRKVCWDEKVHHTERVPGHGGRTAAIVGTILGGAIGNNVVDDSDDRQTARIAGAVLGGAIGHKVGRGRGRERHVVRTERHCEVEHVRHEEERVTGYRVTYRYDGRRLVAHRGSHPGDTIRLRVRVEPSD